MVLNQFVRSDNQMSWTWLMFPSVTLDSHSSGVVTCHSHQSRLLILNATHYFSTFSSDLWKSHRWLWQWLGAFKPPNPPLVSYAPGSSNNVHTAAAAVVVNKEDVAWCSTDRRIRSEWRVWWAWLVVPSAPCEQWWWQVLGWWRWLSLQGQSMSSSSLYRPAHRHIHTTCYQFLMIIAPNYYTHVLQPSIHFTSLPCCPPLSTVIYGIIHIWQRKVQNALKLCSWLEKCGSFTSLGECQPCFSTMTVSFIRSMHWQWHYSTIGWMTARTPGATFLKVPRKILGKLLILGATDTQVATSSRGYSATVETWTDLSILFSEVIGNCVVVVIIVVIR